MQPNFSKYMTAKFHSGSRGPDKYDCWGLVLAAFQEYGVFLPDYKLNCFDSGLINTTIDSCRGEWERIDLPVAPCLVVMRTDENAPGWCNHLGTFIGDGYFVHIGRGTGVLKTKTTDFYWMPRIEGFYRWKQGS